MVSKVWRGKVYALNIVLRKGRAGGIRKHVFKGSKFWLENISNSKRARNIHINTFTLILFLDQTTIFHYFSFRKLKQITSIAWEFRQQQNKTDSAS